MAQKEKDEKMLMYKGKPLVRSENTIYYGSMSDEYVAMLQVQDSRDFSDMKMPSKVLVQIWSTDEELRPKERIKKKTEKDNLYDALKIASIWLERTLNGGE